ncbi:phage tail fiber protein [Candidatus Termititenax persephonae]|uniref:Phage tail fiber protein n=1 Tax=Candidatus Termititenax persephonae TaxID=2218525 RepID=A0A388TEZ0_9BACT|nr:phage tail fiber protein [Candidatus Termititenax persephonae]
MASNYGDQAKYEENPYNINFGKAITASGVRTALGTKEDVANKQDTITDNSTYYPSAKAAYAHTSNKSNPHGVTIAQLGALPSTRIFTKSDIGLGSVNNTSDAGRAISSAEQTALNNKQNTITWVQSISVSSTHSHYPTAKAVWDFVQASKPRLRVSASQTSVRTTWYDAVRKCIEETHAATDVPYSVKADMTANGYTASATEANCISYQDMYVPGRHKIYRLLTAAEWMECRTTNKLSTPPQRRHLFRVGRGCP